MKTCTRCGASKAPSAFYASQPRSNTCVDCVRADQRLRNRARLSRCKQNREYAKAAFEGRVSA